MTTLFYILGYLAVVGFICLAYLKIKSYMAASPLHVRWELYPVPHEGVKKAAYGGSFMEEKEWWTKPRHISHWGDIKGILVEVLCLHATLEHNPKLWLRTYPFHVGMYMLMGGTIIVILAVLAQMLGMDPQGGFMIFVSNVISAVVLLGAFCIVGGGIALIQRRRSDEGLKKYTTPEHFLNLGAFVLFGLLTLAAWAFNPSYFELARTFIHNLFTFTFQPLPSVFFTLNLLVGFFLLSAALSAIGLLISSLTENQAVAAGVCFGVMLLLYFMSSLSSFVPSSAGASLGALLVTVLVLAVLVRVFTKSSPAALLVGVLGEGCLLGAYFAASDAFAGLFGRVVDGLSVFTRFDTFAEGMFDWTAVIYHLSIIAVALFLAVQTMEKRRWS